MADLIDRQAAIDAIRKHEVELPIYIPREVDIFWNDAIDACCEAVETLPPAQPEKRTEERTETHARDYISRQAAIEVADAVWSVTGDKNVAKVWDQLKDLPAAPPEIIRCSDCKYSDENWRRVSVRWLPCMDIRPGSNWYCGSAERRTDEQSD